MAGLFENFARGGMALPSQQQAAIMAQMAQQNVASVQGQPWNQGAAMLGQALGQRRAQRQEEERANIFNTAFEESLAENDGDMQLAEIAAYTKAAGQFASAGNRAAAQEMYQLALAADERRRAYELEVAKLGGDEAASTLEVNKMEDALRKEVDAQLEGSDTVVTQLNSMERNLALNSPAGDLAAIFSFMKVLDPTSVVRESEFRTVEQAREGLAAVATGQSIDGLDISQEAAGRAVALLRGTRFTDITRAQIVDAGRAAAAQRVNTSRGIISDALSMAEGRGYDIESVRSGLAKSIQDVQIAPLTQQDYSAVGAGIPLSSVLKGDYDTSQANPDVIINEARAVLGMQ